MAGYGQTHPAAICTVAGIEQFAYGPGKWQGFNDGKGMIIWHPNLGAYWVHAWGSGRRQAFERAFINWAPTQGAWVEWR